MKVIVAGFSKTGTKSMAKALTLLGFNVYDLFEQFYYQYDEWKQIMTSGGDAELFRKMFKGVDAVSDVPGYAFWEEIQEAYPDSKIILMTRNEDSWYKSVLGQLEEYNEWNMFKVARVITPTGRRLFSHFRRFLAACYGAIDIYPWWSPDISETVLRQRFRQHNSYVLQNAPKDKLLVYKMQDGWEPLCKFLNIDVPDIPFPHKNVGGSAYKEAGQENVIMKNILREVQILAVFAFLLFAVLGWALMRIWL